MDEYILFKCFDKGNRNLMSNYVVHHQKLGKKMFLPNEALSLKIIISRIFFTIITLGETKIYYVLDEYGEIVHTSYLIPKCIKFPFLEKGEFEIGPCYTRTSERGKGIYPDVLKVIIQNNSNSLYMLIHKSNIASIRGATKAGFKEIGKVKKTRFKQYILEVKHE